jgi:hypothetical protein
LTPQLSADQMAGPPITDTEIAWLEKAYKRHNGLSILPEAQQDFNALRETILDQAGLYKNDLTLDKQLNYHTLCNPHMKEGSLRKMVASIREQALFPVSDHAFQCLAAAWERANNATLSKPITQYEPVPEDWLTTDALKKRYVGSDALMVKKLEAFQQARQRLYVVQGMGEQDAALRVATDDVGLKDGMKGHTVWAINAAHADGLGLARRSAERFLPEDWVSQASLTHAKTYFINPKEIPVVVDDLRHALVEIYTTRHGCSVEEAQQYVSQHAIDHVRRDKTVANAGLGFHKALEYALAAQKIFVTRPQKQWGVKKIRPGSAGYEEAIQHAAQMAMALLLQPPTLPKDVAISTAAARNDYPRWLHDAMRELALEPEQLAERAALPQSALEDILNGRPVMPTEDACLANVIQQQDTCCSHGAVIKAYRNAHRWSNAMLASKSGVSVTHIRDYITNARTPSAQDAQKLATALHMHPYDAFVLGYGPDHGRVAERGLGR